MSVGSMNLITQNRFKSVYGLSKPSIYELFCEKLDHEINKNFSKGTEIKRLNFRSSWKDQGKNIHASLEGEVCCLGENGEIHGEIVYLQKLKKFRGYVTNSLSPISDLEYIEKARLSFKSRKYEDTLKYISLITDKKTLTKANLRMIELAEKRMDSIEPASAPDAAKLRL
jgi:hypothetical protein